MLSAPAMSSSTNVKSDLDILSKFSLAVVSCMLRLERVFLSINFNKAAFIASIERGDGQLLNIGTGIETSIQDLYEEMASALGVESKPEKVEERPILFCLRVENIIITSEVFKTLVCVHALIQ